MVNQAEMNELKSIKSNLLHEFIEVSKKDGQLQAMDTLMHTIKNLCKVIEDCEKEDMMGYSGYSYGMNYSHAVDNYNPMMPAYANNSGDYSGARRRDNMGRYSSHGDMKSSLYEAMNHASNEMERQQIQDLINRLG